MHLAYVLPFIISLQPHGLPPTLRRPAASCLPPVFAMTPRGDGFSDQTSYGGRRDLRRKERP